MYKKYSLVLLIVIMNLFLFSCGHKNNDSNDLEIELPIDNINEETQVSDNISLTENEETQVSDDPSLTQCDKPTRYYFPDYEIDGFKESDFPEIIKVISLSTRHDELYYTP